MAGEMDLRSNLWVVIAGVLQLTVCSNPYTLHIIKCPARRPGAASSRSLPSAGNGMPHCSICWSYGSHGSNDTPLGITRQGSLMGVFGVQGIVSSVAARSERREIQYSKKVVIALRNTSAQVPLASLQSDTVLSAHS